MKKHLLKLWFIMVACIFWFVLYPRDNYFETIAKAKENECQLRREKQTVLDDMSYTKSVQYFKWEVTTKRLQEIDAILESWVSTVSDCKGINYHGVSFVPKVHAGEPTVEWIKKQIKKNSEQWGLLDTRRLEIIDAQGRLNKENINLRKQLPKKATNSVIDTVKNAKLRDTNKVCKVDWKEVSLWAVVYGFVKQEWGYREWTPWYESNNRWSLRVNHWIVPIKWTRSLDNTSNWLEYYNVQDWLYHLSYVVVEKGYDCNIWRRSIFCYVYGCGGDHTAIRDAETTQRYNTFKKNAFSY